MIYVSVNKLCEMAGVEQKVLDYFIKRDGIRTKTIERVECVCDANILTLLTAVSNDTVQVFSIMEKIFRHNDDTVVKLEKELEWHKCQLATIAETLDKAKELCGATPIVDVVKRPMPEKPVQKQVPIKANKNGTRLGMTPVVISVADLSPTAKQSYDKLMHKTKELFESRGLATACKIYELMGSDLVAKLGDRYANESGRLGSRVTTLTAPILAAQYSNDKEVRECLKGVI